MGVDVRPISQRWVAERLPERGELAHKGDFGRLLVVAGSIDYPGAALLTALGAMRAGAGVVRVAAADSVVARVAGSVPEATWMPLDEEAPGLIGPGGWRRITAEASRYDALVVGPGLGSQPSTQRRARQLIATLHGPAVVDADGLNALAADDQWWKPLRGRLVLTPHPGEFARLGDGDAPPPGDDDARATAAAEAAARWNQVLVLKGARTVVASPDGDLLRSEVATPALATAGSGDLLSGIVGALLGAGLEPFDAAACGVAIHGAAGLRAAERVGTAGVMARDVAALIPEAIGRLRGDRAR